MATTTQEYSFDEAIVKMREDIKMTHDYFGSDEYCFIRGNLVVFEDGVEQFLNEFRAIRTSSGWNTGWTEFK